MQPHTDAQIAGLAFLDAEARKQGRMFLWMGACLLPLAIGFPVATLYTDVPGWVGAIMAVCAGLLGGVCLLLAFTRGSPLLGHLRNSPADPVVRAQLWVEVRRGVRNLQVLGTTRAGVELHEVLFVSAGEEEQRVIDALRAVVPSVELH